MLILVIPATDKYIYMFWDFVTVKKKKHSTPVSKLPDSPGLVIDLLVHFIVYLQNELYVCKTHGMIPS